MSDAVLLEKSKVVQVTFHLAMPVSATREQVAEWVAFTLNLGDCDGGERRPS